MPSRFWKICIPVVLVAAGVFYYVADPVAWGRYMPQCVWRSLTGFSCPGCGLQRACHALLHGHPLQALRYNYFFIVSIPLLICAMICWWKGWTVENRFARFVNNHWTLWAYIALALVWWVVRNVLGV